MFICEFNPKYLFEAAKLAQETYLLEQRQTVYLSQTDYQPYFLEKLEELLKNGYGRMAMDGEQFLGYFIFSEIFEQEDSDDRSSYSPLYGYGARGKQRSIIISKLFQDAAKELCENYTNHLRISIYAHDREVLGECIMNGFSMDVADSITDIRIPIITSIDCNYKYRELKKAELLTYKADIIEIYRGLINHLRSSPIFYHCRYFIPIEERVDDFLSDDTRIFTVFDKGQLIGMVDAEQDTKPFITGRKDTISMGDIFLKPAYRGKNIAASLLQFANNQLKESNYKRLCVRHGTINPTARGFWEKYFQNYSYTLIREIDSSMLGNILKI